VRDASTENEVAIGQPEVGLKHAKQGYEMDIMGPYSLGASGISLDGIGRVRSLNKSLTISVLV